jgi:hypothetical protein
LQATNNKGKEKIYSAERFLIATGERPRYLGIPGDKEYCISRWVKQAPTGRLLGSFPGLGKNSLPPLSLGIERKRGRD